MSSVFTHGRTSVNRHHTYTHEKRRLTQQPPYPRHDLFLQEGYFTIMQRVISTDDTDFAFLLHLG